ncbi:MAG TPA: EscU/YscU/HrcU family type III secretion system export apparatus switch protein [Desulfurivibrionaceae bacterium]|nr:EscU/YscU/HrcU family type III secretion system export apparatus switch protein [Desulfurivibrionaceae bacterium]
MPEKSETDKREARKKAVALRYDQERAAAPTVVAKGTGLLAERLIELAQEHGVPIHEDSDLAEILARLDLNAEIPPATYVLVAEILAFVYRANQRFSR